MVLPPGDRSFRRLALGDIANDLAEATQPAGLVAKRGDRHVRQELGPVLPQPPALLFQAAGQACPREIGVRLAGRNIVRRVEQGKVSTDDFGFGPALDALCPKVPDGHPALRVEHVDGVACRPVDQQTQLLGQPRLDAGASWAWARCGKCREAVLDWKMIDGRDPS